MNFFRTHLRLQPIIGALALLGWFVLSNHCALGSIGARAGKAAHPCCHNGSPLPAPTPADGPAKLDCCQALHAVVPAAAVALDGPAALAGGELIAWLETERADGDSGVVCAVATGPPAHAVSFSELVLQRSLRSHAPPFRA